MTIQIAVKLPDELVSDIDSLVGSGRYETRSQVLRESVETFLRLNRRRAIDDLYVRAYTDTPETDEELAEAERLGIASINEEPWAKWW